MYYTERLMLRSIDLEADAPALLQLFNDEEVVGIGGLETALPFDRGSIKSWMEKIIKKRETGLPFFVVCEKPQDLPTSLDATQDLFLKDGKSRYPFIGLFNFFRESGFSISNRVSTIGIGLARPYQSKGYGTELMEWAMEFAFASLGLHKLELQTRSSNKKAIGLYEKVGFKHEGVLRSAVWNRGKWDDKLCMGLIEDEWRERQPKTTS